MITKYFNESEKAFKEAGETLRNGGIVAFATDTVYGLGAIYTDREAVRKIFRAKGRDEGKPLSILVSDITQAARLVEDIPSDAEKLMNAFWPGALTIILKKNDTVPIEVSAGGETVGIRMPANTAARMIIAAAGSPLAAPSANTSGKRSSVTAEDVKEDLDGKIDMIVDGGACSVGISSTVVDMSDGQLKILRSGTVTAEMIEDVIGRKPE